MLKKIFPIMLVLCLVFSISAMAETEGTATDRDNSQPTQEMPVQNGERPQGAPPGMANGERPQGGGRGGQMPQGEFTPPEDSAPPQAAEEVTPPQNTEAEEPGNVPQSTPEARETTETEAEVPTDEQSNQNTEEIPQFEGRMPGGMQGGFPGTTQDNNSRTQEAESMTFSSFVKTYSTPITSIILLALAFVFVIFYRRKNY